MRSALTMIILTIGLGFILFLKITSEFALTEYKYAGVETCKPCHSVKARGDQYGIWKNSRHSSAYFLLLTDKALRYTEQNKLMKASENDNCLGCHTTAFGENESKFLRDFIKTDGVQCEECHNPGSEYSKFEVMKNESKFKSSGGEKGSKIRCVKCHAPNLKNKDFRRCPFQTENFNYEKSFSKIRHSIPK